MEVLKVIFELENQDKKRRSLNRINERNRIALTGLRVNSLGYFYNQPTINIDLTFFNRNITFLGVHVKNVKK